MIRLHSGIGVLLSILCVFMAGSLPASAQEVSVSYSADTTWVDTPIRVDTRHGRRAAALAPLVGAVRRRSSRATPPPA